MSSDGSSGTPAPQSQLPPQPQPQADPTLGWLSLPAMRFPNEYVWLIFFSSMDIMLTWAILARGGREVNPIADMIISIWGLTGAILFKFSLMLLVVIVCEVVSRQRERMAKGLAWIAVVVSALPVCYSLFLLLLHAAQ